MHNIFDYRQKPYSSSTLLIIKTVATFICVLCDRYFGWLFSPNNHTSVEIVKTKFNKTYMFLSLFFLLFENEVS